MKKQVQAIAMNETLQAALTIIIWTTMCILYIMEKPVPDTLLTAGSIVLGFYFHNAIQKAIVRSEAKTNAIKRRKG